MQINREVQTEVARYPSYEEAEFEVERRLLPGVETDLEFFIRKIFTDREDTNSRFL